jgi:cobalt-zinc-cadmium efflux system outer membrane protein
MTAPTRFRPIPVAALAGLVLLAGCRTYEARPLDRAAVRSALAERPARVATDPAGGAALVLARADAERAALLFNPSLRLARLEAGVARAAADASGLWEDPTVGVDLIRFVELSDEPWVVAGMVDFTIPISGRLESEKAKAEAGARAELTRVAALEWETVHEVRALWAERDAAEATADLLLDHVGRLEGVVALLRAVLEAGNLGRAEFRFFELDLVRRRLELEKARGEAERARLGILAAIGFAPDAPVALLPGDEVGPDELPLAEAISLAETRNLDLRLAVDRYEEREKALELEIRKQVPDFRFGAGGQTDEGRTGLLLGFSIPIPVLNANRQAIDVAEAERRRAAEAYAVAYESLVAGLGLADERRREAAVRLAIAAGQLVPLAEAQWNDAIRLIELGETEPVFVVESLDSRLESSLALIESRRDVALAAIAFRAAIGPEPAPPGPDGSPFAIAPEPTDNNRSLSEEKP